MRSFLKSFVVFYRYCVSPIFIGLWGAQCRYQPSCSENAEKLLSEKNIPLNECVLKILKQFLSCHPFTHKKEPSCCS